MSRSVVLQGARHRSTWFEEPRQELLDFAGDASVGVFAEFHISVFLSARFRQEDGCESTVLGTPMVIWNVRKIKPFTAGFVRGNFPICQWQIDSFPVNFMLELSR